MTAQFYDIQMCEAAPYQIVDMCHAAPYKDLNVIFRSNHTVHSSHHHPQAVEAYTHGGRIRSRRMVGSRHRRHGGSLNPIRGLMTGGSLNPIRSLMTGGRIKRHVGSRKHRKTGKGRSYIKF